MTIAQGSRVLVRHLSGGELGTVTDYTPPEHDIGGSYLVLFDDGTSTRVPSQWVSEVTA